MEKLTNDISLKINVVKPKYMSISKYEVKNMQTKTKNIRRISRNIRIIQVYMGSIVTFEMTGEKMSEQQ